MSLSSVDFNGRDCCSKRLAIARLASVTDPEGGTDFAVPRVGGPGVRPAKNVGRDLDGLMAISFIARRNHSMVLGKAMVESCLRKLLANSDNNSGEGEEHPLGNRAYFRKRPPSSKTLFLGNAAELIPDNRHHDEEVYDV